MVVGEGHGTIRTHIQIIEAETNEQLLWKMLGICDKNTFPLFLQFKF